MDQKTSASDCYGTAHDQIRNVRLVEFCLCTLGVDCNSHYFADVARHKAEPTMNSSQLRSRSTTCRSRCSSSRAMLKRAVPRLKTLHSPCLWRLTPSISTSVYLISHSACHGCSAHKKRDAGKYPCLSVDFPLDADIPTVQWQCSECFKYFNRKGDLTRHENIHSGIRYAVLFTFHPLADHCLDPLFASGKAVSKPSIKDPHSKHT